MPFISAKDIHFTIRRAHKVADHPHLRRPHTHQAYNLALCNPSTFQVIGQLVYSSEIRTWATFFLVGMVSHSHLLQGETRSISVIPLARWWSRSAAALAGMMKKEAVLLPTWEGGMSFRTNAWAQGE